MQSIEEKIYEVFWDKNIARMINRADLFSFLKQYVNPGLLTKSSKPELVHDLKEYMTTDNLEFIAERMESFGLPMVDTVSVLDTTSYAVKKLVDNDTLRIVGTFKGGNQRIPYKLCSVLDILDISHSKGFVPCNARGTNEFKDKKALAYLVNFFMSPEIRQFVNHYDLIFDEDMCSLSALLQWMWRSQIRNGKPIDIYIPSERMRELLNNWIQDCYVTEKVA